MVINYDNFQSFLFCSFYLIYCGNPVIYSNNEAFINFINDLHRKPVSLGKTSWDADIRFYSRCFS